MDVVALLESKNRCLRRFLDISIQFLTSALDGDLSGLETFHVRRDAIIRTLELYDRKVAEAVTRIVTEEDRKKAAPRVQQALNSRETLVMNILQTDQQIMKTIEIEKGRVQEALNLSRKAQTNISKFKSTWVPGSGEELDKKL